MYIDESEVIERLDKSREVEPPLPPDEVQKYLDERANRMRANLEITGKKSSKENVPGQEVL